MSLSSMTAVLYSAMPLAVSLFTPAMMHRKVPRRAVYAMVIGFGGLLSLFYTEDLNASPRLLIGGAGRAGFHVAEFVVSGLCEAEIARS